MNSAIQKKIEIALVVNLYKQANIGFVASIICCTIVFFYLNQLNPNKIFLFFWFLTFLSITLIRSLLVSAFLRKKDYSKHLFFWKNAFILGAIINGILWGLTGTSLLLPENQTIQTFMLIILAGMSAGAVPLLAHVKYAALGFVIPALGPLVFHYFSLNYNMYTLFDITLAVYLSYLITLCFRTHRILRTSMTLQFENETLLQNLYEVKNQLEVTNQRLQQAATHDPLTSVANRSLFETQFTEILKRAEKDKKIVVLFYLDLDGFKEINDIYGHNAGDQLLIIVVSRIKNVLRENDFISRLGGDEITIILQDVEDLQTVAEIAERVCQVVAKPIKVNDKSVGVYASIGISIYPIDGTDMDTLLRIADRSMYYVKDHGGNNYHFNVQVESTHS